MLRQRDVKYFALHEDQSSFELVDLESGPTPA
jgi:hypothetical protein